MVYRALHVSLNREVALKLLAPEGPIDTDLLKRFRLETTSMSTLVHANLVKILDAGVFEGRPFIAMELVQGRNLFDAIRTDPHRVRARADEIFRQVLRGVAFLHEKGFVHRDLKPGNLMETADGRVLVMDLGLIKLVGRASDITRTGARLGTPAYMAPEALRGEGTGPAADVWALGCIYYELLAGVQLFAANTLEQLYFNVIAHRLPPLETVLGDERIALRELLAAMLEADPARRPRDAGRVLKRFEEALGRPDRPRAPSRGSVRIPSAGVERSARMGRALVVAGGVALAALVAVGARRPAREGEVSRKVEAPAPSTSPAVRENVSPGTTWALFDEFTKVEPFLSAVRVDSRRDVSEAVTRLTALTGVPLGNQFATWTYWVKLGRWFQTPERTPPKPVVYGPILDRDIGEGLFWAAVQQMDWDCQPERVLAAQLTMQLYDEEDPMSWACLADVMTQSGDVARGRIAARVAAERMPAHGMPKTGTPFVRAQLEAAEPRAIWVLAQALVRAGDEGLVSRWCGMLPDGEAAQLACWMTLVPLLPPSRAGVIDRLVERAAQTPRLASSLHAVRLLVALLKGEGAPGGGPDAAALVRRLPPAYQLEALAAIEAEGRLPAPAPEAEKDRDAHLPDLWLLRLLAAGRTAQAARLAGRLLPAPREAVEVVEGSLVEAAGRGVLSAGDLARFSALVKDSAAHVAPYRAAGALATPAGLGLFPAVIAHQETLGHDAAAARDEADSATMLWLSRCGDHVGALTALDRALQDRRRVRSPVALEVLARPHLRQLSARDVNPATILSAGQVRARHQLRLGLVGTYVEALEHGLWAKALATDEVLAPSFPRPGFLALARMWVLRAAGDETAAGAAGAAFRRMCLRGDRDLCLLEELDRGGPLEAAQRGPSQVR